MCRRCSLLIATLVIAAGCGHSEFVPLTGKVTLDGKLLSSGGIRFVNADSGPAGYAAVQTDGSYVAHTGSQEGLKPGTYQITVVVHDARSLENETASVPPAITPARYADPKTSGLLYTLPASGGAFDIALNAH